MSTSEFYYACRNGDIAKVKGLLPYMFPNDIDCMEPNGSTALHAASYYGHIDIVRLLLDKGASPIQKNKYDKTPEEEARTAEIAQLLHDAKQKLDVSLTIDDIFSGISQHRRFYSFNQGPPTLSYVVDKLLSSTELINAETQEDNGMDQVNSFFRDSIQKQDSSYILRAYTLQSPFYSILNKTLATHVELTDEERENPPWFCAYARFLASDDPQLRAYRWVGTTYRGTSISKHRLAQLLHLWEQNKVKLQMNKTFLSTTKKPETAEIFARGNQDKDKQGVIYEYIMNYDRAAFDTTTLPDYPMEDEVIILPCMDFQIQHMDNSGEFMKIKLELV